MSLFVFACVFFPLFLLSIGLIQIAERVYAVSEFLFLLGLTKYLSCNSLTNFWKQKDIFVEVLRFVLSFRRATVGGWGGYSLLVLVTD